eukprot:314381-Amphidinium_carterae.1
MYLNHREEYTSKDQSFLIGRCGDNNIGGGVPVLVWQTRDYDRGVQAWPQDQTSADIPWP